jgi:hypothetical protein
MGSASEPKKKKTSPQKIVSGSESFGRKIFGPLIFLKISGHPNTNDSNVNFFVVW